MDKNQLLAEIVVALSNIDYDLRRWEEELEQEKYRSLLDDLSDWEMYQLDQSLSGKNAFVVKIEGKIPLEKTFLEYMADASTDLDALSNTDYESIRAFGEEKEVPLAWYSDGTRFEIGTATVDSNGHVSARISDAIWSQHFRTMQRGDYSIVPSIVPNMDSELNYPEYRLRPLPATRREHIEDAYRAIRVSREELEKLGITDFRWDNLEKYKKEIEGNHGDQ